MMTEDEEEAYDNDIGCEEDCGEEILFEWSRVSLNALNGLLSNETMRLKGVTEGKEVNILLDCGSAHCFIDEEMAKTLSTHKEYTTPLMISVAGGKIDK